MRAIHPESQDDAMEWHPIFEFRRFEQNRKDEKKKQFKRSASFVRSVTKSNAPLPVLKLLLFLLTK